MRENGPPFVTLIIVVLAALAAAQLLLVAVVLLLAEIMGSLVIPCLVVGVFMLLLGVALYRLALRESMREIHERMGVVYGFVRSVQDIVALVTRLLFRQR